MMKRIVFKAKNFQEAADWDARQYLAMTPEERIRIAHALRQRAYRGKVKDVRECHRKQ
jgi:hypothetical protein